MKQPFLERLKEKVIVFDGAMGTNLQRQNLTPGDFGGKDGCNEYLVITKPQAVLDVHQSFFRAGCDVVETNTFGANRIVLAEYDLAGRAAEINEKAARLARQAALEFSRPGHPRYVAGSIGPGTKLPSLGHIGFDELREAYTEQIRGLDAGGGVDLLLVETCQDLLQAKIAVIAAEDYFRDARRRLPLMVQITFETTGTMLLGTEMGAVISTLEMFPVDILGMNCATGPREMADPLRYLAENTDRYVSAQPNAGLPENIGGAAHYKLSPGELADAHERFVREFGVSIVGGCCGTTPEHLKAVAERVGRLTPAARKPRREPSCASLYSAVGYRQDPPPLLVGEQANANGSRKFKQILERDDYDGLVGVAREAAKEGAHLVDVCVAYVGRDEVKDMRETIFRFNQHVTTPLVVDSTEAPVIEEALKRIAGKPVINSINLEDGEEKMARVCPLARRYGAALVALVIDEQGMAKTRDRKLEIAGRIYDLATRKYGIRAEDLFFDALTFTIGSGDAELRNGAVETLEAIRLIKRELPGVRTILGVSNISFGLAPNARPVLNSVFLHEAVAAGLDAAIVHAKKILPIFKISPEDQEAARNLIYNRTVAGRDPLAAFIAHFGAKAGEAAVKTEKPKAATVEEALTARIVDGDREGLEADLDRALEKYKPLDIINRLLLDGMKEVGELFGAGKMQLPFVLQSAEVMKKAVAHLERFMEKTDGRKKGRMVLATVKGDVHDIGKNLVDIILTNNGYEVINLGIKQPVDAILKAAAEHKADAIGLSGLLVKSTLVMKENLEEMNQRGISLPVICGGAALTRRYVEEDLQGLYHGEVYYGQDAFSGLRIMDEITRPGHSEKAAGVGRVRGAKMHAPVPEAPEPPAAPMGISYDTPVPKAPFFGYRILKNIRPDQIFPWINKTALFRAQWQFRRGDKPAGEYDQMIRETVEPLFEEWCARAVREKLIEPKVIYGFYPCYSEAGELVVLDEKAVREEVRFRFPRQKKEPFRSISDFFRPKGGGEPDVLGVQLVTVGERASEAAKKLFEANRYTEYLYLHGLSVESAEGLAEYVHALIRADLGIGGEDSGSREEIFRQGYRGSRYSFGYPACPNLEDQKKLFELLPAEKIGVGLTDEFQLVPEQSTSAVVVHHPQAKYFNV